MGPYPIEWHHIPISSLRNPHQAQYQYSLLTGILDGKEISATSRKFLQNWQASKEAQKKKKEEMDVSGTGDPEIQNPYSLGERVSSLNTTLCDLGVVLSCDAIDGTTSTYYKALVFLAIIKLELCW